MGHLTGHLAPCLVSFGLGRDLAALGEVMDHKVISPDKGGELVLPFVDDVLEPLGPCGIHLLAHGKKRVQHPVDHAGSGEAGDDKKQEEYGNDEQGVECRFGTEVDSGIGVWRAQDCKHTAVSVEDRGVHGIERFVS